MTTLKAELGDRVYRALKRENNTATYERSYWVRLRCWQGGHRP